MKEVDISIQNISKIEGHADLDIKVRGGKVKEVHFKLTENKRFFTQAIRGRSIDTLPQAVARICGTCSLAHTLCCIEAIEKALHITPSEQTKLLKKLAMYGLIIRDHALHLYFFSLPDVFNKDSVLDFDAQESKYLHDAFAIKRIGNKISTIVAGRAIHAPFPLVGGFAQIPDAAALRECKKDLEDARQRVLEILEVYYNSNIDYNRETNFVSLVADKFDFLEGEIRSSNGLCVEEKEYAKHLKKTVIPYSQAIGYKFEGKTYMVGALARLNLNKQGLHRATKRDARKYLRVFPSSNVFHNNLAQGIEILHCIDHTLEIIENLELHEEEPQSLPRKACTGVGVIEAPRGTLFYNLAIDKRGIVKNGTIVVPTQQNQINIELDIKKLVQKVITHLPKEKVELEIEKLIRAYDPCISCASHFLKVNWG